MKHPDSDPVCSDAEIDQRCSEVGPYGSLLVLFDKLVQRGVCADVAAQVAGTFVSTQCCSPTP